MPQSTFLILKFAIREVEPFSIGSVRTVVHFILIEYSRILNVRLEQVQNTMELVENHIWMKNMENVDIDQNIHYYY